LIDRVGSLLMSGPLHKSIKNDGFMVMKMRTGDRELGIRRVWRRLGGWDGRGNKGIGNRELGPSRPQKGERQGKKPE
jgi:hypothetical protein